MGRMNEHVLQTRLNLHGAPAPQRQTERVGLDLPSRRVLRASVSSHNADSITARRNVLAALWAGKLLGLSGEDLTVYASSRRILCKSDAKLASVLAKDLRRRGVAVSDDEIRAALARCYRVALHQTCATD
jgi:hypothetical protein